MENNIVQNLAALKALPSKWNILPFNEVLKDISGGNKKTLKSDFLDKGEFAIVDQGQSLIAGYTNNKELLVKASPPYVVFGDHTRAFKFIDVPFAMGADGTKVLKPKNEGILSEKYLYYFFLTIDIPNTGYNRHFKYLKELKIPLPPLAEQQKIAAILDTADSLRQKDQQLVERYTALSQSLFLEMFGDPVTNPMGWEIAKLKDVCTKITDGTHHSPELIETGVPYVTAKHVKDYGLDFDTKPTYVSQQDHEEIYKRCSPEYGDLLYIKDGATTGIACINTFKEPISLLSSLALLKSNQKVINNYYLCNWLNHNGVKNKLTREYMSGAAIQRYTLAKINSFTLMVPPIELQNQFAEHIQFIEAQKQQAQACLEKSEALFNSLLQRAFTGELTADRIAA